ncbi:MAG: CRISPR-associated endoribonuclease Cas6 [Bacteroidia bacterium]|nr:CRISPR-associated endoribonuclease Cas6 [Bacteroidia bacterium]
MRLLCIIKPSLAKLSFSYPYELTRAIHKRLGENNRWHDALSLYSFSFLIGTRMQNNYLTLPNGAKWYLSSYDREWLKLMFEGLLKDPVLIRGVEVKEIIIQECPKFEGLTNYRFYLNSPVLLKSHDENYNTRFITFEEPEAASQCLTHSIHHKMDIAGLSHLKEKTRAWFDKTYPNPKTKLIEIKGIKNRCNVCPVIVEGPTEALEFVWMTGLGNGTGTGFGAVQ